MKKVIQPGNFITRYRAKSRNCYAVMINSDPVTLQSIQNLTGLQVKLNYKLNDDVDIEIGNYKAKPGDYLVREGNEEIRYYTWKSFHAIFERVPNSGAEHIRSQVMIQVTWADVFRFLFGKGRMLAENVITVDVPVAIIHSEPSLQDEKLDIEYWFRGLRHHWYFKGQSSNPALQRDQCMTAMPR